MAGLFRAATVLLIGILGLTPSLAQSEADAFTAEVKPDVMAMSEPELRSFLGYLAECSNWETKNQVVRHACQTARIKYQTEFKRDRALDKLIERWEYAIEIANVMILAGGAPKNPKLLDDIGRNLRGYAGEALNAKHGR